MAPGGQRLGLRSSGSLLAKTNLLDETRTGIPPGGLHLRLNSGVTNSVANENLAIASGDLRSYAKELASNSNRVLGSHRANTNITKKINPVPSGGSHSHISHALRKSPRKHGSQPAKNTILDETDNAPFGGSPLIIKHVTRKNSSQRVLDSVLMAERMAGTHLPNKPILNETSDVPLCGSHSFIDHILRKSPRKLGSHRILDSVTSSPRSHRASNSQRVIGDSQIVSGSQIAVGSQPRSANTINDTNTELSEVPLKKRTGRKKAQNKFLNDFIDSGGEKPLIEIPMGKRRPLGKWGNEWVTEMGIIVSQNIPLTFHYWKELKDEHKNPLYKKVQSKFEVDLSKEHVREAVDHIFKDRFKDRRHKLHSYYLSIPEGANKLDFPEKTVTQLEWENLCEHFESKKFKASCERNKKNRAQPRVNHRGGRKSFIRHRFEQRDSETGEEPDCVDFYRNMRWNDKKGWIDPQAKDNYEKMLQIRSQISEEDGEEELSDAQIAERVLGKRSGYVMGLGHGEVPPSRKCRAAHSEEDLKQMRQKAAEQEQELVELRAWKASQEELSKSQQLMIEAQAKKQEEADKKQEETNIFLNALKERFGL